MKKLLGLVLAVSLLFMALTTYEGANVAARAKKKPVDKLTIMLWAGDAANDPQETVTKEIINKFNQTNKLNCEIVPEFIVSEQTKTKLPTLMAANTPPDIFMAWAGGYLEPYVKAGKVFSLQKALNNDPAWAGRFLGGITKYVTYSKKVYAIPTSINTQVALYNTEIFKKYNLKIPDTHEELVDVLIKLRNNPDGIIPMAFANKESWPGASYSEILANRIGGDKPFNNAISGKGKWTDPSFAKAGELLKQLSDLNVLPKGYNGMAASEAVSLFRQGKAAVIIWSSYVFGSYDEADSPIKGKVLVKKCPGVQNGKGDINKWLGQPDRNLVVSAKCKRKDAAVAFIKYFTAPENQQLFVNKGILTTLKANVLDATKAPPLASQLMNLHKDMTGLFLFYDVLLGPIVGNEYNNTVGTIMAGKPAQQAFRDFQKFYDENKSK